MSRARTVCLLRRPAEIESLSKLLKLQLQIKAGTLTEAEAAELFKDAELPACEHHHHITVRKARKMENVGEISFLAGWDEQYAEVLEQRRAVYRKFSAEMMFSTFEIVGRLEMYAVKEA